MGEISLWGRLKQMGFKPLTIELTHNWVTRVLDWIYNWEPLPDSMTFEDFLVATIDGKDVEISCDEIGYFNMSIDGEVIFSQRRFDDEDLLRLLPKEPIKITPKHEGFKYNFVS
jgi:hypothetical protein